MGGAIFVLAINMTVAALLMAAFLRLASYQPLRDSATCFAAAYGLGMAFFAIEFAIPLLGGGMVAVNSAYAAFLMALTAFNLGLARLYHVRVSVPAYAAIIVAAIAVKLGSDMLPRASLLRLTLYQLPFFAIQAIGIAIVLRSRRRTPIDIGLMVVLLLSSAHFLAKPVAAFTFGGVGQSPAAYSGTLYALISQSVGAVLGIAAATILLVILIRDLMAHADLRSQTDQLSGLLNRRGFMEKGEVLIGRSRTPTSLVVCDLDHFKSVNDTYGHACGDEVIACFGATLGKLARKSDLAGRIGGEEFAVLLAGCDLAEARSFAERVRSATQQIRVSGMPEDRQITISVGIAQLEPGENLSQLFMRADDALYLAKRAGRNRVLAPPPRTAVDRPSEGARRA